MPGLHRGADGCFRGGRRRSGGQVGGAGEQDGQGDYEKGGAMAFHGRENRRGSECAVTADASEREASGAARAQLSA